MYISVWIYSYLIKYSQNIHLLLYTDTIEGNFLYITIGVSIGIVCGTIICCLLIYRHRRMVEGRDREKSEPPESYELQLTIAGKFSYNLLNKYPMNHPVLFCFFSLAFLARSDKLYGQSRIKSYMKSYIQYLPQIIYCIFSSMGKKSKKIVTVVPTLSPGKFASCPYFKNWI